MAKKPVAKKKVQKQNGGRAFLHIDWDVVDKCLISGSSGIQTAAFIGVHYETLYDRCVKEKKMSFTDYSQKQRQKGNSMILGKQLQVAMGGNVSMLIWLGKQRLKQADQPQVKQEFNGSLASLLDVMHLIKSAEDFDAIISLAKTKKTDDKAESKVVKLAGEVLPDEQMV